MKELGSPPSPRASAPNIRVFGHAAEPAVAARSGASPPLIEEKGDERAGSKGYFHRAAGGGIQACLLLPAGVESVRARSENGGGGGRASRLLSFLFFGRDELGLRGSRRRPRHN